MTHEQFLTLKTGDKVRKASSEIVRTLFVKVWDDGTRSVSAYHPTRKNDSKGIYEVKCAGDYTTWEVV